MDLRAAGGEGIEFDPLAHGHSEATGDKAQFAARYTANEQMVNDRLDGPDYFDLHAASDFPRFPFAPIHFSIDAGEFVPEVPVGKNVPGKCGCCVSLYGVVKMVHDWLFRSFRFGLPSAAFQAKQA